MTTRHRHPFRSWVCGRLFLLLLVGLAGACSQEPAVEDVANETTESDRIVAALQASQADVPGFALAVIEIDGATELAASGVADPAGRAMTATTPVRIASNTKTFVAAAVLRLWEDGLLELDAPIADHISTRHNEMLTADGYDTQAITIRHLLMHASGLDDHFAGDAYKQAVIGNPTRVWTRTDQLLMLVDNTEPRSAPGKAFFYSDSGYLLLGEVIERTTGQPLGAAVRQLTRLDELGLAGAWWDEEESPPSDAPERAHQWLGGIDSFPIHGSMDAFGGGGLVASVEELAIFMAALFAGDIFERSETLDLMTNAPGHPADSPYRIGLFAGELEGLPVYGHGGFWGTDAFVVPDAGIAIAGAALDQSGTRALRKATREYAASLIRQRERGD